LVCYLENTCLAGWYSTTISVDAHKKPPAQRTDIPRLHSERARRFGMGWLVEANILTLIRPKPRFLAAVEPGSRFPPRQVPENLQWSQEEAFRRDLVR